MTQADRNSQGTVTHLVARAYRPGQASDQPQILYIALFQDADGKHGLAWALTTDGTEPGSEVGANTPWKTDLKQLELGTGGSTVLDRSWERIDFFRRGALSQKDKTTGQPKSFENADPRFSLDAIADERPATKIKWTWRENSAGKVSPAERPATGPVSRATDRTCLYLLMTGDAHRYLVANVRLRCLLGHYVHNDQRLQATTWQVVVPLGREGTLDPDAIWDDSGDLRLRDVFLGLDRNLVFISRWQGHSFSRDVRGDGAFSLGDAAPPIDAPPAQNETNTVQFGLGSGETSVLTSLVGTKPLAMGPFKFDVKFSSAVGGLGFADYSGRDGSVRLRFYVKAGDGSDLGPFWVATDPFLVQEQSFGAQDVSRPYQPRGEGRSHGIEWSIFLVHSRLPQIAEDAVTAGEFVKWWSDSIACPVVKGLRAVDDGAPVSFVPSLQSPDANKILPWFAALAVHDRRSNAGWWPPNTSSPSVLPDFEATPPLVQPGTLDAGARVRVRLEGATTVDNAAPVFSAHLVHRAIAHAQGAPEQHWAFRDARVAVDTAGVAVGVHIRPEDDIDPSGRLAIGALDLTLTDPKTSYLWLLFGGLRNEPAGTGGQCGGDAPIVRLEGRLPIHVAAGAVDRLAREDRADVKRELDTIAGIAGRQTDAAFERDLPIVIDLSETKVPQVFELRVQEALGDARSHDVQMSLFRPDAAPEPSGPDAVKRRIMVIDRTPFGVYLARTGELAELASSELGEVAIWLAAGEGGAHWRLADPPGGVEVLLPPQGMGEAMVEGGADDPKANAPVEFRFAPHARLVIDPTYEDRRYGEVPWNVRRLFGYAEQRLPGTFLTGFDVELLYGLSGHAEGLDGLLIAESEARLGRPPGRQSDDLPWTPDQLEKGSQATLWQEYRREWSLRWRQLASRLAVLETYRQDGAEPRIDRGLQWSQRRKADLMFPLEDYAAAKLAKPAVGGKFSDVGGLPGGWSWGFASLNILDAVVRDGKATSGFVTGLKFSALGGWGFLKASFDEDRTSIYADTAAGRTHFYSLERIGRIGVFWNRAKHVIVYERTVAPSRQFADQQSIKHLGRPMLRKVAEYVELLEPERTFPDSDAVPAVRGCVTALSFKSTRIPVDSRWGEDVGDMGWKIPLWNPRDGRRKSDVYPRPQVHFHFAPDPEADVRAVKARCASTELLYFYTDTRQGTGADTNAWEPIRGVDFGVAGSKPGGAYRPPAFSGERLDDPLPPEVAVPPGLHQFTFAVEPPERPANLTADRSAAALNASLHNVTLMRSAEALAAGGAPAAMLGSASELYGRARALEHTLKTAVDGGGTVAQIRDKMVNTLTDELKSAGSFVTQAKDLTKKYTDFKNALHTGEACSVARTRAAEVLDRWVTRGLDGMDRAFAEVLLQIQIVEGSAAGAFEKTLGSDIGQIKTAVNQAIELIQDRKGDLESLVKTTAEDLQRALKAASHAIAGVQRQALDGLDSFEAELAFARERVEGLLGEAHARIYGLGPLTADVDRWCERVADARAAVRTLVQQVNEALEQAERTVASRGNGLGKIVRSKIVRADDGVATPAFLALRQLRATLSSLGRQVDEHLGWVLAQRHRAAEAQTEIGEAIKDAAAAMLSARDKLHPVLEQIEGAITISIDEVEGLVTTVTKKLDDVIDLVAKAIEDAAKALIKTADMKGFEPLVKALADARDKLDSTPIPAKETLDQLARAIRRGDYASRPVQAALAAARTKLTTETRTQREAILNAVKDLCAAMSGALADWLDKAEEVGPALLDEIKTKLQSAVDLDGLRRTLGQAADRLVGEAAATFEEARRVIEDSPVGPVLQQPDRAIRLLRAFGDPPQVPKLDFNRAATAFLYGDPKDAIDITPVTAWFDQVGGDLKALGIRLPTDRLLDRLLPHPDLPTIDLGKLLPDFAGLKLDRLFRGLKAPAGAGEGVRVTHGLDKQRQRVWAEAVVDVEMESRADLFAFGPLALRIHRGHLDAVARLEISKSGQVERRANAKLLGDWQLDFGGQTLVTFRRTTLELDENGQTRFDLSPERMEMAPALRFLTDLARKLQYSDGGFVFRILERNGIPYGAEAFFEIALPPLQYGTTGLIGATIGAGARLLAYPDFAIALDMHVSRRESPFIFSVFVLGGAGYVEASALYLPFRDALTADVSIGLSASASLGFAFGPISGQVAVMLGVAAEYHRRPGQGGGALGMSLNLLVLGRVDVMSIATIHISLLLAATYHETGRVTARGALRVSIRITRFFKISVRVNVTYDFKSGKSVSQSQTSVDTHPALQKARELAGAAR